MTGTTVVFALAVSSLVSGQFLLTRADDREGLPSDEWLVRLEGGPRVAQMVAARSGYTILGQVTGFDDTYRMVPERFSVHEKRGGPSSSLSARRLIADSRVRWAERQYPKERQKRDFLPDPFPEPGPSFFFQRNDTEEADPTDGGRRKRRFNDELWDEQWYMQDSRARPDLPELDLHVLPCYDLGVTGKGVRVVVLDDGIEYTHYDLRDNYDSEISYDANDDDPDPTPRYDPETSNAHGTRCAGEVAMKANNGKCGVGIAHDARIGAIRLLDGRVDDRVEGIALGYAYDKVDIYSASWGPNDDGKTVEGPGRLALEAIERGVTRGRNGSGVIYVWAAGNGGSKGDNCECDGYTGSIYTLSVGSASQRGRFPWYGEKCPSTVAVTYSSGARSDRMIATTDLRNGCTVEHTGTSASAPLAAGIIALALEINPRLTWRDVQHLVVRTSDHEPLADNDGWFVNAAGLRVNTRFGFGLMNAFRLVRAAADWSNVPPKSVCSVPATVRGADIFHGRDVYLEFDADACAGHVDYLEHVELQINVEYPVRGNLEIDLTSPGGTRVRVLSRRKNDLSDKGFLDWRLMSVLTWNENPVGTWSASIADRVGSSAKGGRVGQFTLHLHGTSEIPPYLAETEEKETDPEDEPEDADNEIRRWIRAMARYREAAEDVAGAASGSR